MKVTAAAVTLFAASAMAQFGYRGYPYPGFGAGLVAPRPYGGDLALGNYCRALNIPSRRLPAECQAYCNARRRNPWWC